MNKSNKDYSLKIIVCFLIYLFLLILYDHSSFFGLACFIVTFPLNIVLGTFVAYNSFKIIYINFHNKLNIFIIIAISSLILLLIAPLLINYLGDFDHYQNFFNFLTRLCADHIFEFVIWGIVPIIFGFIMLGINKLRDKGKEEKYCSICCSSLKYIELYGKYYCDNCKKYELG